MTIGHNQPDIAQGAVAQFKLDVIATFEERKASILKSAGNAQVKDRETAGMVADVVRVARTVKAKLDAERTTRSDPYRQAANGLKGAVDEFWYEVEQEVSRLAQMVDDWDADEAERIKAQREEHRAALPMMGSIAPSADTAPAPREAAPVPAPEPKARAIVGDLGGRVTRTAGRIYAITDPRELPEWVLESAPVMAAMQIVLRQSGKHMKTIPGVEITTAQKNRIG